MYSVLKLLLVVSSSHTNASGVGVEPPPVISVQEASCLPYCLPSIGASGIPSPVPPPALGNAWKATLSPSNVVPAHDGLQIKLKV